ncbi:MAG TPA: MoaD/ThiS family protein [Gammaproteobacteria bacterium]|nr:MoaD/ThiS family protein [Gammaproteobacteria bacterium]
MRVLIPSQLQDYTRNESQVEARGGTVGEILDDLDRRFPGIRFRIIDEQDRIRRHLRVFINEEQTHALETPLKPDDRLIILGALSGG